MKTVDLKERVITLADVEAAVRDGATELVIGETSILTPSAREAVDAAMRAGSQVCPFQRQSRSSESAGRHWAPSHQRCKPGRWGSGYQPAGGIMRSPPTSSWIDCVG